MSEVEVVTPAYYSPERIDARINAYVEGVTQRISDLPMKNPYEQGTEQFREFRNGYLEGRTYEQGRTKLFFFMDDTDSRTIFMGDDDEPETVH